MAFRCRLGACKPGGSAAFAVRVRSLWTGFLCCTPHRRPWRARVAADHRGGGPRCGLRTSDFGSFFRCPLSSAICVAYNRPIVKHNNIESGNLDDIFAQNGAGCGRIRVACRRQLRLLQERPFWCCPNLGVALPSWRPRCRLEAGVTGQIATVGTLLNPRTRRKMSGNASIRRSELSDDVRVADTPGTTAPHARVGRLPSAGAERRFSLCVGHGKLEVPSGSKTPSPRTLPQPAQQRPRFPCA